MLIKNSHRNNRYMDDVWLDRLIVNAITHLLCVRKLPLTCPEPSHPGVGHDIPSVFTDFQENWEPFRYPSFCLLVARGHPDALR